MQPLCLTLKGFRGILDGLGLDAITLDLERLSDGGELIAIAGANGRGKTTVMDNMKEAGNATGDSEAGKGKCSSRGQLPTGEERAQSEGEGPQGQSKSHGHAASAAAKDAVN